MTEDQLKAGKLAFGRLQLARSRISFISTYPAGDGAIQQEGLAPPDEMVKRHRVEYEHWATQELVKAEAEFAAL